MANWPDPVDFTNAIKNPNSCFQDTILKPGTTQMSSRKNRPISYAGAFAIVYRVKSGGQDYAVRCFTSEVTDQKDRYDLISKHIGTFGISCLVDFEYIEQGIQIKGDWYPIVRMDYVDGVQLHEFVEHNLQNPDVLNYLAVRFNGLVGSLSGNDTAHCDLQHGNILVNGGAEPYLVDYDAMWTQDIEDQAGPSGEIGRSEYQHPERDDTHFGIWLDNFSAINIYLSLGALAIKPDLWSQFHNGDNLIFIGADFQNPKNSSVFQELKNAGNLIISAITEELESCCKMPIVNVPSLKDIISRTGAFQGRKGTVMQSQPIQPQPVQPILQPQTAQPQPVVTPAPPPPPPQIPQIQISTTRLDFGEIVLGTIEQQNFEISNSGTGVLQISSVTCPDPSIIISGFQNIVLAGSQESVSAIYQPTQIGDLNAVLEIDSNAGQKQIILLGKATDKAIYTIQPNQLFVGGQKEILILGSGFEIEIKQRQVRTGSGKNTQTQTVIDEIIPAVTISAPGIIINSIQYISPTTLRGFIEIPKNCIAGDYDIIVNNPIDPANPTKPIQIVGKNVLKIQDIPQGQVLCKKCGQLMDKPDPKKILTQKCPNCGFFQNKRFGL